MAAVDTNASERGPGLQRGRQLDAVHILTSNIMPPQNVVSNIMCTFLFFFFLKQRRGRFIE